MSDEEAARLGWKWDIMKGQWKKVAPKVSDNTTDQEWKDAGWERDPQTGYWKKSAEQYIRDADEERPSGLVDFSERKSRPRMPKVTVPKPNFGRIKLPSSVPMKKQEADSLRDALYETIGEMCEYADDMISNTNKARHKANIWSTISDDDLEMFADMMLQAAQRSGTVAQAVRGMVGVHQYVRIGRITIPRALATIEFYRISGGFMFLPPLQAGEDYEE